MKISANFYAAALLALAVSCQSQVFAQTKAPVKPAKPAAAAAAAPKAETKPAPEPVIENIVNVQAEDLVRSPNDYLNKNIRFSAPFFAFSNVALDYKPALRPAKTHFSFLVLRTNSRVPLSELKLAMPIPKDEKDPMSKVIAGFKEKDELEITGKVYAVALDEPWVDVLRIKKLKSAPDEKAEKEKAEKAERERLEKEKSESK